MPREAAGAAPGGERFPRRCRLTREADIMRVHRSGARHRTRWFDVRASASALGHPRVAVVVPKFGKTAVSRNRVKRRLRELVRRELLPTLAPQDVVVRATPASYDATFDGMRVAMRDVSRRLGAAR